MKKIIIDTNCLLSFVTDRNKKQQDIIASLFKEAGSFKKILICHQHVISEFVFVLGSVYDLKDEAINRMISDLIVMPGITTTSEVDIKTLLSLWPETISDYGDAVISAYCKHAQGSAIATFDKKFNRALKRAGISRVQL